MIGCPRIAAGGRWRWRASGKKTGCTGSEGLFGHSNSCNFRNNTIQRLSFGDNRAQNTLMKCAYPKSSRPFKVPPGFEPGSLDSESREGGERWSGLVFASQRPKIRAKAVDLEWRQRQRQRLSREVKCANEKSNSTASPKLDVALA